MTFSKTAWPLIGQDHVLRYLISVLTKKAATGAYLFHGPQQTGKRTAAEWFLAAFLCQTPNNVAPCGVCVSCTRLAAGTHPDITVVNGGSGSISIEAIRDLQHTLSRKPALGTMSVAVVDQAHRMTLEAASALLKTLEDAPKHVVVILCADALDNVPLTVQSRCQGIEFRLVPDTLMMGFVERCTESKELAQAIARAALGRPGRAVRFMESPDEFAAYQEQARALLDLMTTTGAQRLQLASRLFPTGKNESTAAAEELTDHWLWILRDLLLVLENVPESTTHVFLLNDLQRTAERYTAQHLLTLSDRLIQLKHRLRAHVHPGLLFENTLLHL